MDVKKQNNIKTWVSRNGLCEWSSTLKQQFLTKILNLILHKLCDVHISHKYKMY